MPFWDRVTRRAAPPPPRPGRIGLPAGDITGVTPAGEPCHVEIGPGPTVLAFLTGSCVACQTFWAADLSSLPRVVIVTPSPSTESRRRIAQIAPPDVMVVMATDGWMDYQVTGAPFFVVVDDGKIRREGPASTWAELSRVLHAEVDKNGTVQM